MPRTVRQGIIFLLALLAAILFALPRLGSFASHWLRVAPVHAGTITFLYDERGRLVAVVDPAGDTAVFRYDSAGNVLGIDRFPSSTVSIIEFAPNRGNVGATVTVTGTAFSPTPTQNTVAFNGVVATVSSSTATQIVTSVPTGATTGPITVTAPAGLATSSTPFTVGGVAGAPTITSFSPAIATTGTAVTINGTNFDPIPSNDKAKFNKLRFGAVTAATATALTATVPSVGSGKVQVTTPTGTATSTADFFVPPAPFTAADVQATNRLVSGGASRTVTISTAGKIAMLVFDATSGQGITIRLTSQTIPLAYFPIYRPDNTLLVSDGGGTSGDSSRSIANTPLTGTYTILVDPHDTYTGSVTLRAGAADLVVTALTVPTTPIPRNPDGTWSVPLSWTVKNQGTMDAFTSWWVDRAYLSADTVLGVGDVDIYPWVRNGGLVAGQTYMPGATGVVPGTPAPGNYYIIVKADADDLQVENNNGNNTRVSATRVTLQP